MQNLPNLEDFVQISVQIRAPNGSDLCSKSDSKFCLILRHHDLNKKPKYLRELPKLHIGFELKSARFLSYLDQISDPNLTNFCSKSDPNLNLIETSGG